MPVTVNKLDYIFKKLLHDAKSKMNDTVEISDEEYVTIYEGNDSENQGGNNEEPILDPLEENYNDCSCIFVGGHIRREREITINNLKSSGFTTVCLFNIHVYEDGTLGTDGEIICKNGEYKFYETQPYYQSDIKSLLTGNTSIKRIEAVIGGWGNESYNHIKQLIIKNEYDNTSILYKNFKALKEAIPEISYICNDDEQCYDVNSSVEFHKMLYEIGYKTSISPYTNFYYWNNFILSLNTQYNNCCTRMYLQCYDGGADINPLNWQINNIAIFGGRTNDQSSLEETINKFKEWNNENLINGAFIWVYNDESWNLSKYANEINKIFNNEGNNEPIESTHGSDIPISGEEIIDELTADMVFEIYENIHNCRYGI